VIDLHLDYLIIVQRILAQCVPGVEVRAFGSRVRQTAKPHSDLDLAIVADKKLDFKTLADLQEAFQDSDLPIRVDVVDWHGISKEFKGIIEEKYEVIQQKR